MVLMLDCAVWDCDLGICDFEMRSRVAVLAVFAKALWL